jgi:hypothetical protein
LLVVLVLATVVPMTVTVKAVEGSISPMSMEALGTATAMKMSCRGRELIGKNLLLLLLLLNADLLLYS